MADENKTIGTSNGRHTTKIIALIVDIILCLAAVSASAYLIIANVHPIYTMMSVVTIIALIVNLIYAIRGYRKKDSSKYRIYMLLSAIAMFILTTGTCAFEGYCGPEFATYIGLDIISICSYVILFCTKDLGAPISLILSLFNVAFLGFDLTKMTDRADFIVIFSLLALSIVGFLMVIGKYLDKTERGTK